MEPCIAASRRWTVCKRTTFSFLEMICEFAPKEKQLHVSLHQMVRLITALSSQITFRAGVSQDAPHSLQPSAAPARASCQGEGPVPKVTGTGRNGRLGVQCQ